MDSDAEMAARHSRILGQLSEAALELALDLQASALAADTQEAKAELSQAFHAVSRSVRQTLALEVRLKRDRRRAEREACADATREDTARRHRVRSQVRLSVERAVWTEAEGHEAERLVDDLDDLLDAYALADDFASTPVEAHIARIRRDLGLSDEPETVEVSTAERSVIFDAAPQIPSAPRVGGAPFLRTQQRIGKAQSP